MSILRPIIRWGDRISGLDKRELASYTPQDLVDRTIWAVEQGITQILVLDQIHDAGGLVIRDKAQVASWKTGQIPGDYLITDQPCIGLAIATADCVPIMVYHPEKPLIAAIHMGWRGAMAGVVKTCLDHIAREYGIDLAELQATIGPCARACCYEIQSELVAVLTHEGQAVTAPAIRYYNNKTYLDMADWAQSLLAAQGVRQIGRYPEQATCTIHDRQFHSHRADPHGYGRNITIIALV